MVCTESPGYFVDAADSDVQGIAHFFPAICGPVRGVPGAEEKIRCINK
jgi:hypothetical protein